MHGLLNVSSEKMDHSKGEETSSLQFLVVYGSCQGECLLSMR